MIDVIMNDLLFFFLFIYSSPYILIILIIIEIITEFENWFIPKTNW